MKWFSGWYTPGIRSGSNGNWLITRSGNTCEDAAGDLSGGCQKTVQTPVSGVYLSPKNVESEKIGEWSLVSRNRMKNYKRQHCRRKLYTGKK
jgi:hypothetical protein